VIHNGLALKDSERTMAYYFKAAGYQTGYIGKWHLGGSDSRGPVSLERRGGYDEWWTASNILEFTSTPFEGDLFDADGRPVHFTNYRVDALTDLAVRFIREKKSRPFYLFLSFLEPHHQNSTNSFIAPRGYAERYRNNFYIPPDLAPFPGDWKSQLPDYYGIIARIDECFGRLTKELSDLGLTERTLVAFTTDHGCHFRTRNSEYKRACHDGATRIPMMLRGPGFRGGTVVPELVSLVDLPPTLLEAAGIPIPEDMQGRSIAALAHGRREGWRNEVFIQMREVQLGRALRTERWKYCIWDPGNRTISDAHSQRYTEHHFYDLRSDPAELVNLIGRSDYKKIAAQLRERLAARLEAAGEPRPTITPSRYYA
jgi:arylsulfatase A-like enzyme